MSNKLLIAILLCFLFACNSSNEQIEKKIHNNFTDTLSGAQKSRNRLIEALKKLKQIIGSNDQQKIANIFDFPKPASLFNVYVDDTTYLEQIESHSGNVTKEIFLRYYNDISTNIWLANMNYLLQNMPIDSLLYKDKVALSNVIKKEPCYNSYEIEIIGDHVTLRMNKNSNPDYQSKPSNVNEIEVNASEICEHSFWWTFTFDGNKLQFKTIDGAD